MQFGLRNAPAMFQRMSCRSLRDMLQVKVYIGDVVIGSKSMAEHIDHLAKVCKKDGGMH